MLIERQFALELCLKEACRREELALLRQHEGLLAVFGKAAAIDAETASRLDACEQRRSHEQRRLDRILPGRHRLMAGSGDR